MFQTKVVKKTHFIFNTFCPKNCPVYDNVAKYSCARQAANGNIIRIREDAFFFMLDEKGKNTDTVTKYLMVIAFLQQK